MKRFFVFLGPLFLAAFLLPVFGQETPPKLDRLLPVKGAEGMGSLFWTERALPRYAPFVLATADESPERDSVSEIEESFGPSLEAMGNLWRNEWARPLDLRIHPSTPHAVLAFLPEFEAYKKIASDRFPDEDFVPPSFFVENILVTYRQGSAFESKNARRHAVLVGAAESLVGLYQPQDAGKRLPTWLHLGLANHLGAIREVLDGEKGSLFLREESPYWRDSLARAAEELKRLSIPLQKLEDLIQIDSESRLIETVRARPRSDSVSEKEALRALREYVRLAGDSLLCFVQSKPKERYAKPFLAFLRDEFRGEGGVKSFRKHLLSLAASLENEWTAFCENSSPPDSKTHSLSSSMALPPDLLPRNRIDLRAEIVRKVRSGRFAQALSEIYDVREKQSVILKPYFPVERHLLETASNTYDRFAQILDRGDKLSADFGSPAEVLDFPSWGTIEVREKNGSKKTIPVTSFPLLAVTSYVHAKRFQKSPDTTLDHATCLLLCGKLDEGKRLLQEVKIAGTAPARVEWLLSTIKDFEEAIKEARARDAIEEIASLDPAQQVEKIRQRALDSRIRASAAWGYAREYLRYALSRSLHSLFELRGLPTLFRGKVKEEPGGRLTIVYSFEEEAQIADWLPYTPAPLAKVLEKGALGISDWSCATGNLRILSPGGRAHIAAWVGDIALAVETKASDPLDAKGLLAPTAGILDNEAGSLVCNDGVSGLIRHFADGRSARTGNIEPQTPTKWEPDKPRHIQVARVGEKVLLKIDGEEAGSLPEKELRGGKVFLHSQASSPLSIGRVSISGKIDPDSDWYRERQAHWVRREIASVLGE